METGTYNLFLPECHVVLLGNHDLTAFDRCITDNPHMGMYKMPKDDSATTRTIKMFVWTPKHTLGAVKLYTVSDPSDLDDIRCDVLVMKISEAEVYYTREIETAQKWTDHIRSVHGNDHRVVTLYGFDGIPDNLPVECTVMEDNDCIVLDIAVNPLRLLRKIWQKYFDIPRECPILNDPRRDDSRNLTVNIDRFFTHHTLSDILDIAMDCSPFICHNVQSASSGEEIWPRKYVISTYGGQMTLLFTEDTDTVDTRYMVYDVMLVVVNRHELVSDRFEEYMYIKCDIRSARAIFICTMPDDDCTDPDCRIQCRDRNNSVTTSYVGNIDNVIDIVHLGTGTSFDPPLIKRIIQHHVPQDAPDVPNNMKTGNLVGFRY